MTARPGPGGTVRLLVGYAVGSPVDALARIFAPVLARELKGNGIVEKRPGASGALAGELTVGAPADGNRQRSLADLLAFARAACRTRSTSRPGWRHSATLAWTGNAETLARQAARERRLWGNVTSGIEIE